MTRNYFLDKRIKQITILICMSFIISGCATYPAKQYSLSADVSKQLMPTKSVSVSIDSFEDTSSNSKMCRLAGHVEPPDNMSFEKYIHYALTDELKAAGMLEILRPKVNLKGVIEDLDFSTAIRKEDDKGEWIIRLKLISSNGNSLTVSDKYKFESYFSARTACKSAAEAFMPAVQQLIGKIVTDQAFATLLTESTTSKFQTDPHNLTKLTP